MKFYAEVGARRTRQMLLDALLAAWCLLWVAAGIYVHSSFGDAQGGADNIGSSGSSLSDNLEGAGDFVSILPIGGSQLKKSFQSAADAAQSMGAAGHELSDGLGELALLLGFLTAIAPLFFVLLPWALIRMRYARRAGRVARLRALPGAEKLLALEALSTSSARNLALISDDPAGKWQTGDADVTRRLAQLALSTYGLKRTSREASDIPATEGRGTATRPIPSTKPRDTEDDDTHWV